MIMIDIHSHILPGIDDGAKDITVSADMLKRAVEDGITDMCVTPHYIHGEISNTASIVTSELTKLRQLVDSLGLNFNLHTGNELYISPEIPELLKSGEVMSLNSGRYVLVELPMSTVPAYTDEIFFEIALLGYTPILAHPERNHEICEKPELLDKWKSMGLIFQINSGSITGLFGKNVQKTALEFITNGHAVVVASDCHTNRGRAPVLSRARDIIIEKCGQETAQLLFEDNPRNILDNKDVENIQTQKIKSKAAFSLIKIKEAILDYVKG
jgi:protein-tyrosine phosphatase